MRHFNRSESSALCPPIEIRNAMGVLGPAGFVTG
jgi:hypothetical protein